MCFDASQGGVGEDSPSLQPCRDAILYKAKRPRKSIHFTPYLFCSSDELLFTDELETSPPRRSGDDRPRVTGKDSNSFFILCSMEISSPKFDSLIYVNKLVFHFNRKPRPGRGVNGRSTRKVLSAKAPELLLA